MENEKEITLDKPSTKGEVLKDKILSNSNFKPLINCCSYLLIVIIILGFIYTIYNKFYSNQLKEKFIEKTVKSSPDSDMSFDEFNVVDEICNLKKKQEDYLLKLNRERNF